MHHNIKLYEWPKNDYDFPFWMGMGLVMLVVCGALGVFLPITLFATLPIVAGHALLGITHELAWMEKGENEVWRKYRELDKDTQKTINLDRGYFVSLPPGPEWSELTGNINKLHDAQTKRRQVEGYDPDKRERYRQVFSELAKDEQQRLEIAQSVREKMKELE